jgi:hypothetical protein
MAKGEGGWGEVAKGEVARGEVARGEVLRRQGCATVETAPCSLCCPEHIPFMATIPGKGRGTLDLSYSMGLV